ncbi:Morn repeat protein [Pandoravirus inopinatum]|uniref:Morn repeat protein n=1 Tax=Pandoravirus inopinatum TaxID=1605721 RepID=A0A0B5J9B4_9VIRU|nr:Morn repeat protein [Pandoravirus inopinatum]AJF97456.1 Morn repeat protein [Pandoravirus inopinatum]
MKRTRSGTVKALKPALESAAEATKGNEIAIDCSVETGPTAKKHKHGEALRVPCPFDHLPDELVMAVILALLDARTIAAWSLTSRRHHALAADPSVWRHLCQTQFGPPLHKDFAAQNKDWRWLYRAHACDGHAPCATVGRLAGTFGDTKEAYIYWGDIVDGVPDGYGLACAAPTHVHVQDQDESKTVNSAIVEHDMYEGLWHHGKMHGHGVRTSRDGQQYVGEYVDDHCCGQGTCMWPEGDQYEGEWKDDRYDGYGVYTFPSGSQYKGHWRDDQRHGLGTYIGSDGAFYKGHWKNGVKHGCGIGVERNGSKRVGEFKRDRLDGFGFCLWPDRSWYNGEWHAGKRHGFGTGGDAVGTKHEGEYIDDAAHGHGLCTYVDGSALKGQWTHGVCTVVESMNHGTRDVPCVPGTHMCAACTHLATVAADRETSP